MSFDSNFDDPFLSQFKQQQQTVSQQSFSFGNPAQNQVSVNSKYDPFIPALSPKVQQLAKNIFSHPIATQSLISWPVLQKTAYNEITWRCTLRLEWFC